MKKKIFLQLFLFLIILFVTILFFRTYFIDKNNDNLNSRSLNQNDNLKKIENNLIENIEYISKDENGNEYIVKAQFGELNTEQPELISLKNVIATISMNNSEPIKIYSNHANYNNINYNTNFYEDVLVIFENHRITSNNLDLNYEENLALISNDVIYKNLNTRLDADKVKIDLITKNSKIFMRNKLNKVKIININ
jgi:hypothetical protein